MNTQKTLPKFESIASVASKSLNNGYGIFVYFTLGFLIVAFLYFLFSVPIDEDSIVIYIILLICIAMIVLYLKKSSKNAATIIDDKGIHYVNKFGEEVENTIFWNGFEKIEKFKGKLSEVSSSNKVDLLNYDVFAALTGSGRTTRLTLFCFILIDGEVKVCKDIFSENGISSMFYTNRLELFRGLLLGLAHFRPDIKIHPEVFDSYFINSDTYAINYVANNQEKYLAFFIAAFVAILLFFALLFLFF